MADDKYFSSFACQRCSKSLRLDESLNSFSEHTSAELNCKLISLLNLWRLNNLFLVPIHSTPDVDLESQATSFDHYVPPCRLSDSGNGANGFMLISDENEVDLLSQQFKVSTTFNIYIYCSIILFFSFRFKLLFLTTFQEVPISTIPFVMNAQIF